MNSLDYVILYVSNVDIMTRFYSEILGAKPVESSPGFSMFVLPSGLKFGLWLKSEVMPEVKVQPGACEIGMSLDSKESVKSLYKDWIQKEIKIVQEPAEMDFGYTFTALDPEDHRIRVSYVKL